MKNNNKPRLHLSCCFLTLTILFASSIVGGEEPQQTIPYQLAAMHMRMIDPETALLDNNLEPSRAVLAEFEWIMGTLEIRCSEPNAVIADSIVKTWRRSQQEGLELTLLDVARQLASLANNFGLMDPEKINFRKLANYWVKEYLLKIKSHQRS